MFRVRLTLTFAISIAAAIGASPCAAFDGKAEKRATSKSATGLEIPPSLLKHIQAGVFIDDWTQKEIDAYYEVLDLARRTDYEKQTAKARENILNQLEALETAADRLYEERKKAIEEQADDLGTLRATRARAFAAQKHRQERNKYAEYRENLNEVPLYKWLVKDLFDSVNENQPSRYHGQLVTLHGHIRKLISYDAHENAFGVTKLYEAWLYPIGTEKFEADDARTNPVVIICTSIPEGMPTGENLAEEASVTGYVFRLHAYRSRIPLKNAGGETKRLIAPMILASKIEWHPPPPGPSAPWWLKAALLGGVGLILLAIIIYGRRDRSSHKKLMQERLSADEEPGFDG